MIYHWCPVADWDRAGPEFSPLSLVDEGFIHFSFLDQVERTSTDINRGQEGLVLLAIDDSNLELIVEDCYEIGEKFPHLYRPLPKDLVVAVYAFPPKPDGTFQLPPELAS